MKGRILFVTHLNPFKATFGAEQRTNLALRSFLDAGFNLDIAYIGMGENLPSENDIPNKCNVVFWNQNQMSRISKMDTCKRLMLLSMFPENKIYAKALNNIIRQNNYSYIFCRYLPFAALSGLNKFGEKLLLDIDDLPSQALQIDLSRKSFFKRIYFKLMIHAYQRDTKKWIKNSLRCFLPNKQQSEQYRTSFLPNIPSIWIDEGSQSHPKTSKNVLFVGKLDWKPNSDGINRFITTCWDKVLSENPKCKLLIGGKGLDSELKNTWLSHHKNIEVLGYIKNLFEFYNSGSIVVCPIYSGAGTNIKILEAMAMKKVCIVSYESTKGYESFLRHGYNCLIADNCLGFVNLISFVVKNPTAAQKIANQGYNDIKQFFSYESFVKLLTSDL